VGYNKDVLSRQFPIVEAFVQHLAYHRALWAARDTTIDHGGFWGSTRSGHLRLALIAWCKVFGSRNEKIHWKKTPSGSMAAQAIQDFQAKVLVKTRFTQKEWETYHKTMRAMRDRYVTHLDIDNPIKEPVPLFDHALQVAYAYEEWVKELLKPAVTSPCTLHMLYEQWKSEASTVVSRHTHQ